MSKLVEWEKQRMSIKEFFELLALNVSVGINNIWEFVKVAFRYYGNFSFLKADVCLRLMYLFHNPYSISRRFLQKKGESNIYAYGETPLTSLEKIAKEVEITSKDTVFELGCGRGRTCFWLRSVFDCSVVGIEFIPEFVERANMITNKLGIDKLQFRLDDMLKADLSGATICYLYGTCLEDTEIQLLIKKFSKLPLGTKIITVSYPLTEYVEDSSFEVMKRFKVEYPWGEADVFLQIKRV